MFRPSLGHPQALKENRSKITYLLTPWSIVLLEKLTGSAASQEIPRIGLLRDASSRNTPTPEIQVGE